MDSANEPTCLAFIKRLGKNIEAVNAEAETNADQERKTKRNYFGPSFHEMQCGLTIDYATVGSATVNKCSIVGYSVVFASNLDSQMSWLNPNFTCRAVARRRWKGRLAVDASFYLPHHKNAYRKIIE